MKYLLLLSLLITASCSPKLGNHLPPYHSPAELTRPVEFAQGNVKTMNGINFSKDGHTLYLSRPLEQKFDNGRSYMGIFTSTYQNGSWSKPVWLAFETLIDAYHPVLSADNQTMFFNSRSHPDSAHVSIPHNIWMSEKSGKGWSSPKVVEGVNSTSYDSYPTIARNNNLYFNSDRAGGKGGMDIYKSEFVNGKYQPPVNVVMLNSADVENDLVVDPDERFIIFNRYIDFTKEIDLYISYRDGKTWTRPEKLDKVNLPNEWELTPTLSPDGKYFFYELNNKIMQIGLTALMEKKRG